MLSTLHDRNTRPLWWTRQVATHAAQLLTKWIPIQWRSQSSGDEGTEPGKGPSPEQVPSQKVKTDRFRPLYLRMGLLRLWRGFLSLVRKALDMPFETWKGHFIYYWPSEACKMFILLNVSNKWCSTTLFWSEIDPHIRERVKSPPPSPRLRHCPHAIYWYEAACFICRNANKQHTDTAQIANASRIGSTTPQFCLTCNAMVLGGG